MALLTPRELELKNQLYKQYKSNKKDFIEKYGSKAEQIMIGRAIKTAKNMVSKEQKQRIKEMVKVSLTKKEPIEEINSMEYVQNRKPIDEKINPMNTVRMDIPLLTRVMELAEKDKENQINKLVKNVVTKLKVL